MNIRKITIGIITLMVAGVLCAGGILPAMAGNGNGIPNGNKPTEKSGNCLSFPVIWAEGVTKPLRVPDPLNIYELEGDWWYWWGTDADGNPLSCAPENETVDLSAYCDDGDNDPDTIPCAPDTEPGYTDRCEDGDDDLATIPPILADHIVLESPDEGWVKAYLQQDKKNVWVAENTSATDRVQVDLIDWSDSLEAVDWTVNSKVRLEHVLLEDTNVESDYDSMPEYMPMLQYQMRHLYATGIDEMWGISTTPDPLLPEEVIPEEVDPNTQATVYSHCARLTIQKLLIKREDLDDLDPADLIWVPETGWTENESVELDLINESIFNEPVWNTGDGPGYYSAEINVKGKVIYGYNWDVRNLHDNIGSGTGAGDYRVTFSFDATCGEDMTGKPLNTFFTDSSGNPVTEIMGAVEETAVLSSTSSSESDGGEPTEGGKAVIDYDENLTYMDIRIEPR
jgi:hypothetical protein